MIFQQSASLYIVGLGNC